jgi:hypothetical protein
MQLSTANSSFRTERGNDAIRTNRNASRRRSNGDSADCRVGIIKRVMRDISASRAPQFMKPAIK